MTDTQKGYSTGYNAGLDALDTLAKSGATERDGLAGLMAVVMHAAYAMAPTEEAAEELIAFSRKQALDDWIAEKGGDK
jgi:hypothetical protein